jgi:hypothetical protein
VLLAEYAHNSITLKELSAKGIFRLKAHEEDRSPGIADIAAQVVQHSPALGHTGSADDYGRPMQVVETLGLFVLRVYLSMAKPKGSFPHLAARAFPPLRHKTPDAAGRSR